MRLRPRSIRAGSCIQHGSSEVSLSLQLARTPVRLIGNQFDLLVYVYFRTKSLYREILVHFYLRSP